VEKAQLQAIESLLAANPLIQTLEPEDFLGHFADASFRAVAECVLKTYSELGHVKSQDVFERLPEMQTRNILARVMDFEDDRVEDTGLKKYEEQLAGALRFLKKARVEGEAAQARSRILASDSGQVSDAMLKEFQEKTKQTRAGAGAFYKGINRKRQSEARLHGQD
jgi:hypothetical protein